MGKGLLSTPHISVLSLTLGDPVRYHLVRVLHAYDHPLQSVDLAALSPHLRYTDFQDSGQMCPGFHPPPVHCELDTRFLALPASQQILGLNCGGDVHQYLSLLPGWYGIECSDRYRDLGSSNACNLVSSNAQKAAIMGIWNLCPRIHVSACHNFSQF